MLTACAAGTEGIDFQIGGIDLQLHVLRLGKHRHRGGGGMHASLALGLGHALYAVHSAFIFKARIRALSVDHKGDFFITAKFCFVGVDDFYFIAALFRVHGIHAKENRRKQRAFLAACTAAYFHDNVTLVVGILRQKQNFQLLAQLLYFFLCFLQLELRQLF